MDEIRVAWREAYRYIRSGVTSDVPWTDMLRKAHIIYFSRITRPFYFVPISKRLGWYKRVKRGPDPNMPF